MIFWFNFGVLWVLSNVAVIDALCLSLSFSPPPSFVVSSHILSSGFSAPRICRDSHHDGGGRGGGGIALLDVPSGFSPQILWDSVEQFVEQVLGYSHAGFIPRIATRWIHPSLI